MELVNLTIDRIIIHQIYRRDDDGNKVTPTQSHEYTLFDNSAMEAFKSRVRDALGSGSKAVQMEIVNQEDTDLSSLVDSMADQSAEDFAISSYDIAMKLTNAQQRKAIPGGIVVVFLGRQGHPLKRFLGVIKAEIHSAYEKEVNSTTNEISLKFVEEVLLTPGTRLYKTAGFFERTEYDPSSSDLNDKWVVMVSDYQISQADGKAAAQYFYADFLGCGYPQTSARTTKQFYEATIGFISSLEVGEIEKSDLLNALTTYLKVDTSSSISAADFASKYFGDIDIQDSFTSYMEDEGIPSTAFTKDLAHIEGKLKFRKVSFGGNVKITAPSQAFKDLVVIEAIPGEPDEAGNPTEWTKVVVKERIIQQE
ncbi:nucleoid-associated protein [Pseudomonas resinovorans]|uniref:Nucleoid-associated protein n=1 Tax=Metapseudomonas resinovorans TaxID=53412 RepID=A0ABT4Y1B9_METRE|nr:nucleoid-associated protein [Pseudomonas resinovorans]MDA8482632.1 nucleoid-associated protein [Pseudomonas resinovorans]